MMAATLNLSILEIVLLLFGAIILGITIHFFLASRKNLNLSKEEMEKSSLARDEWKLRYFNDMETRDKELISIKDRLADAEENSSIYGMEADEMRRQNNLLKTELENSRLTSTNSPEQSKAVEELHRQVNLLTEELHMSRNELDSMKKMHASGDTSTHEKPDYLEQLRQAQRGLLEHNQKINQLLGNLDIIKEKEEKEREILRDNEELVHQLGSVREQLSEKEMEINSIRQKELLTKEMSSMLDNAYSEFSVLQSKIQKLETQLHSSKMLNLELEDLKEEHSKMLKDLDENKQKANRYSLENQDLDMRVRDLEDKLHDATYQKQQLQKRVAYLEELNNDLQVVSDANKKLENQLRRVGELESMLNVVSEERDQLMKRASK